MNNKKLVKILSVTNEKLQTANENLETANENLKIVNMEKNEFIGIVAHNLKNPIANMSIIADTVKSYSEKLPYSQLVRMMDSIQSSSDAMVNLISNLLDINAIEDGKYNVYVEDINLHTILMELIDTNKPMANKKNITLFLYMPGEQVVVNYDERIFREIIGNYISNAIKFSPFDVSVYIILNKLEDGSIKISVKDEGPGLSEDDQSRLFNKYTKLSTRPTADENSTGLGLSIVKKLAELMNSQVICESVLGQGAEFSLIISTTRELNNKN
ncbi:Sensor histidine kinase ResE [bioreactor metagenome]|uniref:histidine kinase n=1 Tax=bioreactor metagenome TaxID=1076179 RepID=A0A645DS33_9ZZZZ